MTQYYRLLLTTKFYIYWWCLNAYWETNSIGGVIYDYRQQVRRKTLKGRGLSLTSSALVERSITLQLKTAIWQQEVWCARKWVEQVTCARKWVEEEESLEEEEEADLKINWGTWVTHTGDGEMAFIRFTFHQACTTECYIRSRCFVLSTLTVFKVT